MQCPRCNYEPGPDSLLASPCPSCGYLWVDTQTYVKMLCDPIQPVKSVMDVGCGLKGVIAQHYFEVLQPIERGYACDIHVLKELPSVWTPLLMDVEKVLDLLGPKSIDFVEHCGMLEHVEYAKALRILRVIELVAKKRVFFTCSALLREVDFKCKADGNPNHAYRSWWDKATFEALGYHVDRDRMIGKGGPSGNESTFLQEVTCWFDPRDLQEPWEVRETRAIEAICHRRCAHTYAGTTREGRPGYVPCPNEPILWDAHSDACYCIDHCPETHDKPDGYEPSKKKGPITRWKDREDFARIFPYPPWRSKWSAKDA
jgi:hypothetical protein